MKKILSSVTVFFVALFMYAGISYGILYLANDATNLNVLHIYSLFLFIGLGRALIKNSFELERNFRKKICGIIVLYAVLGLLGLTIPSAIANKNVLNIIIATLLFLIANQFVTEKMQALSN